MEHIYRAKERLAYLKGSLKNFKLYVRSSGIELDESWKQKLKAEKQRIQALEEAIKQEETKYEEL